MSIFAWNLSSILYYFAMFYGRLYEYSIGRVIKRRTHRPRKERAPVLDYGEETDNSAIVVVDPRRTTPRQETHHKEINKDLDDMQDALAERNAAIESLRQDLEQERQARIRIEDDNQQLSSRLKSIQTKWKRTANELDQLRSKSRDFAPVTDEELKNQVTQLRYNIRNFAIQYFSDCPVYGTPEVRPKYLRYLPIWADFCLEQPETYPILMQALIWTILDRQVLNSGIWAGYAGRFFGGLWKHLASRK